MAAWSRWLDALMTGLAWLAAAMIAFALLSVTADVVLRYFFNSPIAWVPQITEYVMLYVPMLAAPFVLKQEEHVTIDLLVGNLSHRKHAVLTAITSLLAAVAAALLAYGGWLVTSEDFQYGTTTLGTVKLPAFLVSAAIPIGAGVLAVQFVRRAVHSINRL